MNHFALKPTEAGMVCTIGMYLNGLGTSMEAMIDTTLGEVKRKNVAHMLSISHHITLMILYSARDPRPHNTIYSLSF